MKKQFLKYFSVLMALVILTTSVGVTRSVHFCAMHQSNGCHHEQKSCCEKKHAKKSCCKKEQSTSCKTDKHQERCCIEKKETFSYSPKFVSKISKPDFSLSVTSVISFFYIHKYINPTEILFINFSKAHSPPLLSGRMVLTAKHILNV